MRRLRRLLQRVDAQIDPAARQGAQLAQDEHFVVARELRDDDGDLHRVVDYAATRQGVNATGITLGGRRRSGKLRVRAMYSENPRRDFLLFMRASVTNLLARFPVYLRFGDRSGRGRAHETPDDAAGYFRRCVDDYCAELGVGHDWLRGKRVLEYGPGDTLGVALYLYAYGAATVHIVDHFPIHRITLESAATYQAILESLDGEARARAERAFVEPGNPHSGFDARAIEYRVTPHGISGRRGEYDLVDLALGAGARRAARRDHRRHRGVAAARAACRSTRWT